MNDVIQAVIKELKLRFVEYELEPIEQTGSTIKEIFQLNPNLYREIIPFLIKTNNKTSIKDSNTKVLKI